MTNTYDSLARLTGTYLKSSANALLNGLNSSPFFRKCKPGVLRDASARRTVRMVRSVRTTGAR